MTDPLRSLADDLIQAMAEYDAVRLQSVCEAMEIPYETQEHGGCQPLTWSKLYEDLHSRTWAWKVLLKRAEYADPVWLDHWRRSGHMDAGYIPDFDDVMRVCAERGHPPTKAVGPEYGQVDYALCLCGKQRWERADSEPGQEGN